MVWNYSFIWFDIPHSYNVTYSFIWCVMPLSYIECDMTSFVLRHDSCMYVMQSRVYTCMCVMQSRVDMCDYEMQSRVNICTDTRIRYASSHVKWFICNIAGVYSTPRITYIHESCVYSTPRRASRHSDMTRLYSRHESCLYAIRFLTHDQIHLQHCSSHRIYLCDMTRSYCL